MFVLNDYIIDIYIYIYIYITHILNKCINKRMTIYILYNIYYLLKLYVILVYYKNMNSIN